MSRIPAFVFILCIAASRSLAVDAVLSHSTFYLPDQAHPTKFIPEVEVYWQINPRSLHYSTTPEKTIVARIRTDIRFSGDTGLLKEDHYVLQTVPRASVRELQNHSIIEQRKYLLPPGFTQLTVQLTDLADSTHPYTISDTFTIAPPGVHLFYSNLQLLDTVIPSDASSVFLKNGVQQVPSCADFLDEYKTNLHYYTELYNTSKLSPSDFPLLQKIMISKNEDEEAFGALIRKDTIRSAGSTHFYGKFAIASLPSGNFHLRAILENNAHQIVATQTLFFQRLNKHPAPAAIDTATEKAAEKSDTAMESVTVINLKKTFIAKYSLGEIRAILKMLLPFSDPGGTQAIQGFLKKPDELYMRYYVYNYFLNINRNDPAKAFKEFSAKIIDVNKRYTDHGVPGYETDRGFIFLRYGPPTDVITVQSENGSLPYEIWQYNVLTQTNRKEIADALFLFYKPTQSGFDFKILHSTVDGEAKNMNWRSYLYTAGSNSDSRAEQYMGNR